MATPHIESKKEDIAKIVLMPGDPLRAEMIAKNYLENYRIVNKVRGMNAYTGSYKGKKVTIFPSGMGIPSMGIYSYELFKFYNVEKIIRIGTTGAYTENLNLFDVVLVENSYSKSNYALDLYNSEDHVISADQNLNRKIKEIANKKQIKVHTGNVYSTETFYDSHSDVKELYKNYQCLGAEMESYALFHNAKFLNKEAACILTVSDNLITKEETSSEERQNSLNQMIEIALNSIL